MVSTYSPTTTSLRKTFVMDRCRSTTGILLSGLLCPLVVPWHFCGIDPPCFAVTLVHRGTLDDKSVVSVRSDDPAVSYYADPGVAGRGTAGYRFSRRHNAG
jgi:hypothetical protein